MVKADKIKSATAYQDAIASRPAPPPEPAPAQRTRIVNTQMSEESYQALRRLAFAQDSSLREQCRLAIEAWIAANAPSE